MKMLEHFWQLLEHFSEQRKMLENARIFEKPSEFQKKCRHLKGKAIVLIEGVEKLDFSSKTLNTLKTCINNSTANATP